MTVDMLDLKLKLLSGEPLEVDENAGYIRPLTIREIAKEGYSNYLSALNIMTLEINDLIGDDPEIEGAGITVFDLFFNFGGEEILASLMHSIELFFQDTAEISIEENAIIVGYGEETRIVDRDNFDKVREVIKWQNCINKFNEDIETSSEDSEAVRRIKERLKRGREAVKMAKQVSEDDENIEFTDIISAVSTKSNSLNKLNVFDLTVFQLYDEFKRLELIDQYDLSIKSMLAGAKNIKLKHWSSKIDW